MMRFVARQSIRGLGHRQWDGSLPQRARYHGHAVPSRSLRVGFSLIELLIVTLIMGVLLGVVAACLSAGLRVWDEAARSNVRDAAMALALDVAVRDLSSACVFEETGFAGTTRQLRFPALVTQFRADGAALRELGVVAYDFDEQRGTLFRRSWAYPDTEPALVTAERLATGLAEVRFAYEATPLAPDGGVAQWVDAWENATNLPGRVRLTLQPALAGAASLPVVAQRVVLVRGARWRNEP